MTGGTTRVKNKDCIKADSVDLSVCGRFNQMNRRLKSKARRKDQKNKMNKELLEETAQ